MARPKCIWKNAKGIILAKPALDTKDTNIKKICEDSLYAFVREAWPHVEGNEYKDGWHVLAICQHLEACYAGDIKRLLINQPPRTSKSTLCAVMFPAWLFAKNPAESIMCVSYSKQLTIRDSTKCRRLMQSAWYKKLWPEVVLNDDENQKTYFSTTKGGYRIATSTGAATTGLGANYILCDDFDNIAEIKYKTYRENNNTYFREVLQTRHAGDVKKFRMICVQQRSHEQDNSGGILAADDKRWVHLRLPMEFDPSDVCETIPLYDEKSKKVRLWRDPRKKEGDLLWPEMLSKTDVRLMKEKDFRGDQYIIAGQLQQRPAPKGGGVFKNEWFKIWPHRWMPDLTYIVQSWDTAFTGGSSSAYSACLTFGLFRNAEGIVNAILLSLYQERLDYPDLKNMAVRLYKNYLDTDRHVEMHQTATPPDLVIIEGKASGYSLEQELSRMMIPTWRFEPAKYGSKEDRAVRCSDVVERGMVWLPCNNESSDIPNIYGQALLRETAVFPAGEYMDIIDAFSQVMIFLKERNKLQSEGPVSNA